MHRLLGSILMGAVRFCASNLIRRRVAGMIVVALLIGLAGAVTVAAFAGARRTATAYPRLLDQAHALDVLVAPDFGETVSAKELAKLPGVRLAGDAYGFGIASWSGRGERPDDLLGLGALGFTAATAKIEAEAPRMTEGRLPRVDRPYEMVVNEATAATLGLHVGTRATFTLYEFGDLIRDDGTMNPDAVFTPITFTIVGIERTLDDLLLNENQDTESALLSPAFTAMYRDRASYKVAGVLLDRGAEGVPAFTAALNRELGEHKFQLQTRSMRETTFAAVAEPYTASLQLFAIAIGLTALIVLAQALMRLVDLDEADGPALVALGASRWTRVGISSARAVAAIGAGAVLTVIGAIALSPLFPLGRPREAEPTPGIDIDAKAIGLGFGVIVLVFVVVVIARAWHITRGHGHEPAPTAARPMHAAERLARTGAPASLVTGFRCAFRDADGKRVSILSTLFGLVVATATVIAALTFATSLDRMVDTPARYGWTWDVLVDTADAGAGPDLIAELRRDQDAAGLTVGTRGNVTLEGTTLTGYGLDVVRGDASPRTRSGRMPERATEIALGAETMRGLGTRVGDLLDATRPDGRVARLRVVGETALPSLALNGTDGLGSGAALTAAGLRRLDPTAEPSFFLVDLADGVETSTLQQRYGNVSSTLGPQRPGAILTYGKVRATPLLLAALLALLGAAMLINLLVTTVRSRRRDLAVLKTMGFTRRQVALTVAAQATTLVATALVVAVPLGVALGRWTWSRFAANIGVGAGVVIPVAAVIAVGLLTILVGNLAAAVPAWSAARTRPAWVLRTE
ncbi:MAG: ABC transporter permease [Acidimicrobiia bacterium]